LKTPLAHRLTQKQGTEPSRAKPAARSEGADLFALANSVDTVTILERLEIAHTSSNRGEMATCPGCSEDGALVCNGGGVKCLHDRCASAGPKGNPGFRTNVDLVALVNKLEPALAAKRICEWNSIEVPRRDSGASPEARLSEPPPDFFDDQGEDVPPDAPPASGESGEGGSRNDAASSIAAGVEWHDARSIFSPLPPTDWVVKGLQICPGRPTLWCGYGYVGKSITAQTIALAMAGGVPVFGEFEIRRGVVRHFDHEQGKHATFKRYQRGAIGLGLESTEVDERLFVTVFPHVYLNQLNAVDTYSRLCEGAQLAIIDALRGATPGEDENDSKIRVCLDNLSRVSEKTGTTFLVLHHSGKPQEMHSDQRTKARGSSAIFDACGPVFILSGSKESPHKTVSQQKAPAEAEGGAVDDFYLTIDDVAQGFNPKAGVRVTYRAKEVPTDSSSTNAHDDRVLEVIRANPGSNVRALRGLARPMRNIDVDDAVERLVAGGRADRKAGKHGAVTHFERVNS
jgi:hypothetical protein